MTKTFNFCKQTVKRDNTVVPGRSYPVKVADDNSVTLRQLNALRIVAFNLTPLNEDQGKDGKDVSGAGANSPSQIIWNGTQFIAVPYSAEHVRSSGSDGSTTGDIVISVAKWMKNHVKKTGKPTKETKVSFIPDPIKTYDNRVYVAITGRMKRHMQMSKKTLIVNLVGVPGFTDEHLEDLEIANDFIGCPVEYRR